MNRYEYVLLDVDNTLFDFDRAEDTALKRVLAARGYPVTEETIRTYVTINQGLWSSYERGEIPQSEILAQRFLRFQQALGGDYDPDQFNLDYMNQLAACGFLLPGALEFCQRLSGSCTLAIVTNGAVRTQHGRLDPSPISPLMQGIFISEEVGFQKPDSRYFDVVCRKLAVLDRAQAVVFGDGLASDIRGGANAGIDTIWYNPRGLSSGDLRPTWQAKTYGEAASIILGGSV